ncbi:MAG: 2-oxo acid dehydrogenase subunit E2 [Candidimonas sp.]|nr:MAG: 2-oxo acid dehydrogenase subunit E2 [Candidimonas sp.]
MATHTIKMPDVGEGVEEVELVAWHVKSGDQVAADQLLADVTTDKATVEVPSPVAGKVVSLSGQPGDVIAVGAELLRLEIDEAARTAAARMPRREKRQAPSDGAASVPRDAGAAAPEPAGARAVGARAATAHGVAADDQGAVADDRGVASADRGAGRSDLMGGAPEDAKRGAHTVPVTGMRRRVARKMQESKHHIPHFAYVEEVDVTELDIALLRLNERFGARRGSLPLLSFLVRAIVLAARDFPQINARYDDEADVVTQYEPVHVGVATQTDSGLVVLVLRHAEALDLWSCAREINRLKEEARAGRMTPDEVSGSTITIASLGDLNGVLSTPIINYPEVAIVGVNRIVQRPVILDGVVVARKVMNLSSSFDLRVVDGAQAGGFIRSIRGYLECPTTLFAEYPRR